MTLVVSCLGQESGKLGMVESNPNLVGKWVGEVSFLTTEFNKEFGQVQIALEIHEDNTISGQIGDAKIIKSKIRKRSWGFEVKVKLDSKLKNDKDFNRRRCFLLLSDPDKIEEDTVEYNIDFHVGAHVGWVILRKDS